MSRLTFDTITLGRKARDGISGLEGTITARAEYIDGDAQVQITPHMSQSQLAPQWVAASRCQYADENHDAEQG